MLVVLITLTPGRRNEFIDRQKANVRNALLPIKDVKTCWNSTVELFERAYWLYESTCEWLRIPKFSDYWPLFTTQDERTIAKYVMEVWWSFWYWTLWMSKWHTVTLHHVITVYNDIFDYMDDIMWALAKNMTQWKEELYFAMKFAWQKVSKYYSEVPPMTGLLTFWPRSLILFGSCDCLRTGTWEWISILIMRLHIPRGIRRRFWSVWRTNTVQTLATVSQ